MQTMPVGISPESSLKPALSSLPSDVRATALAHWRGAASRPHGYAKCGRGLASGLPAEKLRRLTRIFAGIFAHERHHPSSHSKRGLTLAVLIRDARAARYFKTRSTCRISLKGTAEWSMPLPADWPSPLTV